MEVEPWLLALAPVVSALAGAWVGGLMSSRQAEEHWQRTVHLRKKEWDREDERRWDDHRLRAYSEYTSAFSSQRMRAQWVRDKGYDSSADFSPIMDGAGTLMQSLTEVRLLSGSREINDAAHQVNDRLAELLSVAMKGEGDETEWNKLHNRYLDAVEEFENATQRQLRIIMSESSIEATPSQS